MGKRAWVDPTDDDPVVRQVSEGVGGPIGSRAGRHPWWTPVRVVLALTAVCMALGMLQKTSCYDQTWQNGQSRYSHMCYSDLPYLYTGRGFAEHQWPYSDDNARYSAMEYPVLISYFAWVASELTAVVPSGPSQAVRAATSPDALWGLPGMNKEVNTYFLITALLLFGCGLGSVFFLAGASPGRPWDAMAFAARWPTRVHALVVVDVVPAIAPAGRDAIAKQLSVEEFDSLEDAVAMAHRFNPRRTLENIRERLGHAMREEPDGRWRYKFDPGISAGAGMANILALNHPTLFAAMGLHSGPVFGAAQNPLTGIGIVHHGAGLRADTAAHEILQRQPQFPGMPAILIQGEADTVVRPINQLQLMRPDGQPEAAAARRANQIAVLQHVEVVRRVDRHPAGLSRCGRRCRWHRDRGRRRRRRDRGRRLDRHFGKRLTCGRRWIVRGWRWRHVRNGQ